MKIFLRTCIVLILIFIIAVVYIITSGVEVRKFSDIDETREASVAIVLGASSFKGAPSAVFRRRIDHAINLYKDKKVSKIIFTGGKGEGNTISDAMSAKRYAIKKGVSSKHILIEEESKSTQGNLINAYDIMTENDYKSALIVSDPLHMKRAMLMAEDIGIEAYTSPVKKTLYQTDMSKKDFLLRETLCYSVYKIYRVFVVKDKQRIFSIENFEKMKDMILSKLRDIRSKGIIKK